MNSKKTNKTVSQSYQHLKWLPPLSEGKAIILTLLILIILFVLGLTRTENSLRCWIFLILLPLFYNFVNSLIKKKHKVKEETISFNDINKMGDYDIKLILLYLQTTNNTIVIKNKFEKWKNKLSNKILDSIK